MRNLTPPPLCLQVMWLPNRQRPFVRKVAPGFQQTSGSKEAATNLRRGHIQRLNLRYTQVSRQELRCPPRPLQLTQGRARPSPSILPLSLTLTHVHACTPTQSGRRLEAQGLLVQRGDVESEADVGLSLDPAPWGCRGLPPGTAVRMVPCSAGFPEAQVCGLTRPCPPLLQGLCILEPECEPLHGQRALALLPAVVRRGPLRHL